MGGHRRRPSGLVGRVAQFDRDAGVVMPFPWQPTRPERMRSDSHQLLEPFDFSALDQNASLPLGPSLQVVNRDRLPADHERAGIRIGEPLIHGRPRDAHLPGRIVGGQKEVGHDGG